MGQSVLNRTGFVAVDDVARDADDEQIHDSGVKDVLDRNAGVGAGNDGGVGIVPLIRLAARLARAMSLCGFSVMPATKRALPTFSSCKASPVFGLVRPERHGVLHYRKP